MYRLFLEAHIRQGSIRNEVQQADRSHFLKGLVGHTKDHEGSSIAVSPSVIPGSLANLESLFLKC